ncbi:WhiB family transcriptional regulator [Rhodococcus ruber]|uniref:WhiB family transcriptional regulator n=1 Tax=Rhodococcus ruber TaxID=1830 RepID=UPI001F26B196|nr:WhiB family transcriptional regulator [Rhodococcus ruber]MCF8784345.1 WhiB family transcriptional regulator [Rhodococcus ruber]
MSKSARTLPPPLAKLWEWQMYADCRQIDSDLFFPMEVESAADRRQRETLAKSVCGTCPVRMECRLHAITVGERYGIWGGTSEADRERLRLRTTHVDGYPDELRMKAPGE